MQEDLKPCPFCGGKAEVINLGMANMVECTKCGIGTPPNTLDPSQSLKLWNTRTEVTSGKSDSAGNKPHRPDNRKV